MATTQNAAGWGELRMGKGARFVAWTAACLLATLELAAFSTVEASSRPRPLRRLNRIDDSSISILPRRSASLPHDPSRRSSTLAKRDLLAPHPSDLRHDDSMMLRMTLPSTDGRPAEGPLSVFLRPSTNLLHPSARVQYHSDPDPYTGATTATEEALTPESVRAYTGWVLRDADASSWWNEELASIDRASAKSEWEIERDPRVRGWARVMVLDTELVEYEEDSEAISWEGAMEVDGMLWHVRTAKSYGRVKGETDPEAEWWDAHPHGGLVAWREADVGPVASTYGQPQVAGCGHDELDFNLDPGHAVYGSAQQHPLVPPPSFAAHGSHLDGSSLLDTLFGLTSVRRPHSRPAASHRPKFNRFQRRQSTGGDISGSYNLSSNFIGSIGSTASCPKSAKVVFVGVAADCTYVNKYGSQDEARTQILSNFNTASALYQRSFNVSLGIVELNVMSGQCPTSVNSSVPWNVGCPEGGPTGLDLNSRLSVFSRWRGQKGGSDGAGLWHLMTNCSTGSEVGVAWLGQLCTVGSSQVSGNQYTSGTAVTAATTSEWQVVAHEVGHNFGAIHDCSAGCSLNGQCCPLSTSTCNANSNYIMSPVSAHNTSTFSPCSVGNICTTLGSGVNTSCLADPGERTVISLQQCGNGIVEPGEDCDPGGSGSACCDPNTCKFRNGAVCDPASSPCCTGSCTFASSSTVCRPAVDPQCDTAETCTGSSATCPADVTKPDGQGCGASGAGLSCAAGLCTSRDLQCRNQGSSMGITRACTLSATSTCQLSCADPSSNADCILLSNNFVDGTECGYGGRCSNGNCQTGSFLNRAKSWYRQNLQISIPVTIVVGILVLVLLFSLIGCFRRRQRLRQAGKTAPSARFLGRPPMNPSRWSYRGRKPGATRGGFPGVQKGSATSSREPIVPVANVSSSSSPQRGPRPSTGNTPPRSRPSGDEMRQTGWNPAWSGWQPPTAPPPAYGRNNRVPDRRGSAPGSPPARWSGEAPAERRGSTGWAQAARRSEEHRSDPWAGVANYSSASGPPSRR